MKLVYFVFSFLINNLFFFLLYEAAGIVFYFLSWIVFKDAEESSQVKPNLEISNHGYKADIVVDSVVTKM